MRGKAVIIILCFCMILSFCISSFSQAPPEDKMRVAVVEFDEKGEVIVKDAGAIVAEWLLSSLAERSSWQLIERALLKKVLEEKGLALTGVLEPETTAEIGRIWQVSHLVVGRVMKFGSEALVTARLIDAGSAVIVKSAQIRTIDLDSLLDRVPELAQQLIGANRFPVITSLTAEPNSLSLKETSVITCQAEDQDNDPLSYSYSSSSGSFKGEGVRVSWFSPSSAGEYLIRVKVEDSKGGVAEREITVKVKEEAILIGILFVEALSAEESLSVEALVFLDNKKVGKTGELISGILQGEYTLKIVTEEFQDIEEKIELKKDIINRVSLSLKRASSQLNVMSEPLACQIIVDGKSSGMTPSTLVLLTGEHTITLKKEDEFVGSFAQKIYLKKGKVETLQVNLKEQISTLKVSSDEKEAKVYLNGVFVGKVEDQIKVLAGNYQIRVEKENYHSFVKEVTLDPLEETEVLSILSPLTGTLKITSRPSEADIYLDQAYKGKTPLSLSSIEVGSHRVKAVKGEQIKEETVRVRAKETASLEFWFGPEGMVLIPAGGFLMGSNEGGSDEKPVHTVYLDAYYIDKYEVTNGQFSKFLNEEGNQKEGGVNWLDMNDEDCLIEYKKGKYQPKSGYEEHAVIEVSWYGAKAYAKWAGKRLPTEAEWEKAARGGLVGKKYPWGDSIDSSKANYNINVGQTTPVGSYPPNNYGLYDVAGNVREWASDWYDEDYYSSSSSSRNPQGPNNASYRVYRDGSWNIDAGRLRCAYRNYNSPDSTSDNLGFRCAKSP